ncbi:MAG TPA: hypothetical protein VGC32_10475 [Solirubrobacterales bacterium]
MGLDLPRLRSLSIAIPLALVLLLATVTSARAEKYPPAPKGDDISFLQLGAVGELVTLELYRAASHSEALGQREKQLFGRMAAQTSKSWRTFNSLLGEGAISREIFTVNIPASVLRSKGQTMALAARFERLLSGLYLSGVESTNDPPTRLLIGEHLLNNTRNLAVVGSLQGGKVQSHPTRQLSVEYVGEQFETYLGITSE